jgi:hypothetical protein
MTKPKSSGKKRLQKRKDAKYPNLERDLNLKGRQDYIETEYIDGVYDDETGKLVIRPLTNEEKQWLDSFYNEYVNVNLKDSLIHDVMTEDQRKSLKNEVKKLNKRIKANQQQINKLIIENNVLKNEVVELKKLDYKGDIISAHNARNTCAFNFSKKTYQQVSLDEFEYDDWVMKQWEGYDLEHMIIPDEEDLD